MPEVAEPPSKPQPSAFERAFEQAEEEFPKNEATPEAKTPKVATPPEKIEEKANAEPSNRAPDQVLKKADSIPEKPKEVAKPPESEIGKIKEPKFKNDDDRANFAALRTIAEKHEAANFEWEKKSADLEKRFTEAEARGKDADALREKLVKLETEQVESMKLVRQANIELDPEFRREFIDGRATRVKRAMEIIEESGGEPKAIETALNLRGKARVEAIIEATQELPAFQQSRLGKVIEELTDLDERAAAQRTDPEKYLEQRKREDQDRDAKTREEQSINAKRAWGVAEEEITHRYPIFQKIDGNDAQNKAVEADIQSARNGSDDPVSVAQSRILAASMPRVLAYLQAERDYASGVEKERDDLKKELTELYGKAPSLRGSGGEKTGGKKGFWSVMTDGAEE